MNKEEMFRESPIVEVFGINPKDAMEIDEYIQSLMKQGFTRLDLLKAAKEKYTGKKLLFAISYIEFASGFTLGIKTALENIIIPEEIGGGEA